MSDPLAQHPSAFSSEELGAPIDTDGTRDVAQSSLDLQENASDASPPQRSLPTTLLWFRRIKLGLMIAAAVASLAAAGLLFWPAYVEAWEANLYPLLVAQRPQLAGGDAPSSPRGPGGAGGGVQQGLARQMLLTLIIEPADVKLVVNGLDHGTAPSMLAVECAPAMGLSIELTREGYVPWRQTSPCNAEGRLTITAQLQPAPAVQQRRPAKNHSSSRRSRRQRTKKARSHAKRSQQ